MPFSLLDKLRDVPLAVVDVETTGSSARFGDRVTEIGVLRIERGRAVAEYQQLVDPCRRINPGVVALTGITQAMVAGQPRFGDVAGDVLDLLRGAAIVGHNVGFDLSFLDHEFAVAGHDLHRQLAGQPVLDTVRIARRRFGRGGNGLQNLARRFGVDVTTAHRALADCLTTAAVLERLLAPAGGFDMSFVDVLAAQGGAQTLGSRPAATPDMPPPAEPLPLELQEALDARRPVRMEYLDARRKKTERVVEPMDVKRGRTAGDATLVGYCHLRGEMRTFKMDRIVRFTRVEA